MPRLAFTLHIITAIEFEVDITDEEHNRATAHMAQGPYDVAKEFLATRASRSRLQEICRDTDDLNQGEVIDAGLIG